MNNEVKNEKRYQITRIALIAVVLIFFGYMLTPFLAPLLMASLFAFAFEPRLAKISAKKAKRGLQTSLIIFALFVGITGPVALIAIRLVQKIKEIAAGGVQNLPIFKSLERAYSSSKGQLTNLAGKAHLDLDALTGDPNETAAKIGKSLMDFTSMMAANIPDFILAMFIFGCGFYYFMTQAKTIRKTILHVNLLPEEDLDAAIEVIQKSSYSTLVTTAAIGAIQALVVAIAALIFGYSEFLIIFLITFFTSFIPVIGAAPVAAVLSAFSFVLGETGSGIGLLIAAAVAGSVDNLIKPLLISSADEVDIHPVVGLITIVGAVMVYGIPGLLLGPVLTSLVYQIVPRLYKACR